MRTTAKLDRRTGKAKQAADLVVEGHRGRTVKGGIIVVGGTPQYRAASLSPLTTRALNPQPLPPRF